MHEAGTLTSGSTKGAASTVVGVDASDDPDVDVPELGMVELPDSACEPLWGAFDPDVSDEEPELDCEPEDCEDPDPEAWFAPEVLVGPLLCPGVSELPHPMTVTTPRATTSSNRPRDEPRNR